MRWRNPLAIGYSASDSARKSTALFHARFAARSSYWMPTSGRFASCTMKACFVLPKACSCQSTPAEVSSVASALTSLGFHQKGEAG